MRAVAAAVAGDPASESPPLGVFRTVGQRGAVAAVRAMLAGDVPHAVLLTGPSSVGKATLALDLAAALLCTGATGAGRPCRACRGCRLVEHANHPDLHRLDPEGPGGQVRIGGATGPPGVRNLVADLALLPLEGGHRVGLVPEAARMNDEAQSALLKTLEEPPASTTLVLCADDEERLLPTVRSRCARVRLGPVAVRDVELLLGERGLADPPTAARLARLADGRPGLALTYARAPEAEVIRGELARSLLDLLGEGTPARLRSAKTLLARSVDLSRALAAASDAAEGGDAATGGGASGGPPSARPRARRRGAEPTDDAESAPDAADASVDGAGVPLDPRGKLSAAERRAALAILLAAWRDLARDVALAQAGAVHAIRDVALLEEMERAAAALPPGSGTASVAMLVRAVELLDANVSPELLLDVALVRWPRRAPAA